MAETIKINWNLPFAEAIQSARDKLEITTANYLAFTAEQHQIAFTIAGMQSAELLTDVHQKILTSMNDGVSLNDFKKSFADSMKDYGWLSDGKKINSRADLIYRNNILGAYGAGRWNQYERVAEERPYLEYVTAGDSRVRPNHAILAGTVKPLNDSFWQFCMPPNGHRCRCSTISYSETQMTRLGKSVSTKDVEMQTIKDPKTGDKITQPKGVDYGFNNNPGVLRYAGIKKSALSLINDTNTPRGIRDGLKQHLNNDVPKSFKNKIKTHKDWNSFSDAKKLKTLQEQNTALTSSKNKTPMSQRVSNDVEKSIKNIKLPTSRTDNLLLDRIYDDLQAIKI
jgi:SPP1 gp7 family putative phage head morphogenesis protein